MSLTALSGIFQLDGVGQIPTISNGDITIPSGTIVSYVPTSNTDPAAAEFVFGMCETMNRAVSTGNLTNCTSSVSTSLISGNTLRKSYTFTVNLNFDSTSVDNLDVKAG